MRRSLAPLAVCAALLVTAQAAGQSVSGASRGVVASAIEARLLEVDGVRVEIPPGAVDAPVPIDVVALDPASVPPLDEGMTNVTRGGRGYRFGPRGSKFKADLRLSIPFDPQRIPAGTTVDGVRAFYFEEAAGRWVELERVSADESGTLVCLTDHFTDIIAATLDVPLHPEVESFAPTMLRDLAAASPAEGVRWIEPPRGNPMGDARLALPIEVPQGRNGMQPKLEVTYQSEGGNGWLGLGWDLKVPDISVDTRWGVPRFGRVPDANGDVRADDVETESYLMDGQALTPLAHRGPLVARMAAPARFHARIEGGFDRIVRHGDAPHTFWWEITDKFGTRSVYGDPPDAAGTATLRDAAGHVFRWALREVYDLHGNAMRFEYEQVTDAATSGVQLYPRAIHYTGTRDGAGSTPGPFTVRFLRDSDVAPGARRLDVQVDFRGGFRRTTAERLRQVRVEMHGALVRAYDLEYATGAFGKSLLVRVGMRGSDGAEDPARAHTFTYYDDVRDAAGGYAHGFGAEETWDLHDDALSLCNDLGPLSRCPASFATGFDRASGLSGAITHGVQGHLYLGLNCGLPTKLNSAGVKTGFNLTRTSVNLGLFDVNGDNLPDKVFRSGDGFLYRANLGGPAGGSAFSPLARPLPGIEAISVETGVTATAGVEQYFGGTTALAHVTGTLSVGTTYTTDANGDGLIDVVRDGQIHYSHTGPGGEPVFEPTSANTPQPLLPGTLDGEGLIRDYDPLFQDLLDQHPLHDTFRRWVAPYAGDIRIEGGVSLETPQESVDGVRVSIQQNGAVQWAQVIEAGDATTHEPAGVERITVDRGDRIYFRVQSVFDGARDAVHWSPRITYLDAQAPRDANAREPLRYDAAADYVEVGRRSHARAPFDGEVRVTGTFVKRDTTSDDVTLILYRNDVELLRTFMPWDSAGEMPIDLRFAVAEDDSATYDADESDRIRLQAVVDSPIDATLIGWREDDPPEAVYESSAIALVYGDDGESIVRFFVPWNMDLYPRNDATAPQAAWLAPDDGPLRIETLLDGDWSFAPRNAPDPVLDGEVTFTVKRAGALVAKRNLAVRQGRVENVTIEVPGVREGDSLFFDVSVRDAGATGSVGAALRGDAGSGRVARARLTGTGAIPVGLHRNIAFGDVPTLGRGLYAQPYRGWTCAGYNGNPAPGSPERPHACDGQRGPSTAPIDESVLVVDASLADVDEDTDPEDLRDAVNAERAYTLTPAWERDTDGLLQSGWRGPDESGWVRADRMSATRIGTDRVGVPCPGDLASGDPGADARAVPRIGLSANVGAGAGFIIAVSASAGTSGSELDFVDLNGDQYPDAVGIGRAQFTLPNGGLERKSRDLDHAAVVRRTNNTAGSVSLGGSIPVSTGGSRGTTTANNGSTPRGEKADNTMPSLGFSGDLGFGTAKVQSDLVDLNGDGLPDRIFDDGTVAFNTGYAFTQPESWSGLAEFEEAGSVEFSLGAGLGFNDFIYSYAGGLSYSRAESNTRRALVDMNGDGLVDRVRDEGGRLLVGFNTGWGFAQEVVWHGADVDAVASAATATLGAGAYVTFGIPVFPCSPVTVFFLILNPGATVTGAMSRQESAIMDVDGDQRPDYVRSTADHSLHVSRNGAGRTNLLRRVDRPLGGHFVLDYGRQGNTAGQPHASWGLSRVELDDGVAGDGPPLLTTFTYAAPRHDRGEREFLGYGEVVEAHRDAAMPEAVYRTVRRTFRNDTYYAKGLLMTETVMDEAGRPLRRVSNEYAFRDVASGDTVIPASRTASILPMLTATRTETLESGASIASRRTFEYDALGNVARVTDDGGPGPEDDLDARITYADCGPSGVLARPVSIVVRSEGIVVAERRATLDCATGDVLQFREHLDDAAFAPTDFTYDARGLVRRIVGPPNADGERYTREFDYDATGVHVTRVTDSFGLESRATWDPRFGVQLSATDAGGSTITRSYDTFGRVLTVTGPYEQGGPQPTLRFEYHLTAPVPWAKSAHHDVLRGAADPIETVLFADGLGRVLQTKVDATVDEGSAGGVDARVASGREAFDFLGRAVAQYQPTVDHGPAGVLQAPDAVVAPTRTTYDALDRPLTVTDPDGGVTRFAYAVAADPDGRLQHETTVIDARGGARASYRDARDLLVGVRDGGPGGAWTAYRYDALDRLIRAGDAAGHAVRLVYDRLGRRVALHRPDAGTTRYAYDLASNLIARTTAEAGEGPPVTYAYSYRRLTAIRYPRHPEDDVTWDYGGAGDGLAAGRIVRTTDGAGAEELAYGKLGEIVRRVRTVVGEAGGPHATQTWGTGYRYDAWGRLLELTCPDGEVISYGYDAGGMVNRVTGTHGARTIGYVRAMTYDVHRQQRTLELGNGVRTTYTYRSLDRRLARLTSANAAGTFQDLHFTYDGVGNVTSIVNDVDVTRVPDFGGRMVERFEYDASYRMTGATGSYEVAPGKRDEYTLTQEFDAIHNLREKIQVHSIVQPSGQRVILPKHSYHLAYRHDPGRPHAPAATGERAYTWDASGALIHDAREQGGGGRRLERDGEHRLRRISGQGPTLEFAYDAHGDRTFRRGPGGETAYVNQFFTVRNRSQVIKHIYVGDTRIASVVSRLPGERGPPPRDRDVYYYHPDHLHGTHFVTDGAGEVREHFRYFPTGEPWIAERRGPKVTDLRFTGREFDEESGFYYLGARYYDPRFGHFASVDPLSAAPGSMEQAWTPPALNVYAYAYGNPVRLKDPSGLAPVWWSKLNQTRTHFAGIAGRSAGASGRTGSDLLQQTDSPVRASAAGGASDVLATAGAGVTHSEPSAAARIGTRRGVHAAGVRAPPAARGPPAPAAANPAPSADARPPVVLGENMAGRVIPYAKSVGAETIVDWLAGRTWTQQLNDDYIEHIKAEGRQILDIGPDFARRLRFKLEPPADRGPRPVYDREREMLRGYGNRLVLFVRSGRFSGGVEGLDFGRKDGGVAGIRP